MSYEETNIDDLGHEPEAPEPVTPEELIVEMRRQWAERASRCSGGEDAMEHARRLRGGAEMLFPAVRQPEQDRSLETASRLYRFLH